MIPHLVGRQASEPFSGILCSPDPQPQTRAAYVQAAAFRRPALGSAIRRGIVSRKVEMTYPLLECKYMPKQRSEESRRKSVPIHYRCGTACAGRRHNVLGSIDFTHP